MDSNEIVALPERGVEDMACIANTKIVLYLAILRRRNYLLGLLCEERYSTPTPNV